MSSLIARGPTLLRHQFFAVAARSPQICCRGSFMSLAGGPIGKVVVKVEPEG
jgi:hypothetical protein